MILLAHPATALGAAATAARGTARSHAASTRDRSAPRPSLASGAATAWPRPCWWSAQATARAGVKKYEAGKNCSTFGIAPTAAVSRLAPDKACLPAAPPLVYADEW